MANPATKANVPVALVLGGHVNSLSVVRELAPGRMPIWVLHYQSGVATRSRYVSRTFIRDYSDSQEAFVDALLQIGQQLDDKAVLFPTHDYHARVMAEAFETLSPHYHVQVNPDSVKHIISKQWQYELCDKVDVPRPASVFCFGPDDVRNLLDRSQQIGYPLVLKPFRRASDPGGGETFRTRRVSSPHGLQALIDQFPRLHEGDFMASEIIPGGPENVWAYIGYCDRPGHIMAGWTGRKLTQRPHDFGVFSTAESRINQVVTDQGRRLLEASEHVGVGEPEFRYDSRDGKYKLMEINPRVMMWHITGHFAGVNLPLIQYYHCIGDQARCAALCVGQDDCSKRLVYMHTEILNVLDHEPVWHYIKSVVRSLLLKDKRFMVWRWQDPRPWFTGVVELIKEVWRVVGQRLSGRRHRRQQGEPVPKATDERAGQS